MGLALCRHSNTENFEVASRFLQVWSLLLSIQDAWVIHNSDLKICENFCNYFRRQGCSVSIGLIYELGAWNFTWISNRVRDFCVLHHFQAISGANQISFLITARVSEMILEVGLRCMEQYLHASICLDVMLFN